MTTSTTNQMSSSRLAASLDLIEIKPGKRFSLGTLRDMLPDAETVLFFAKLFGLDASQLASLLHQVLNTDLTKALFASGGEHSNELQDYLVGGYTDEDGYWHEGIVTQAALQGTITASPNVPHGEILPQVWKDLEVEVASSIQAVAAKLESTVNLLPGKQGSMIFQQLMKLNARRPVLGDYVPSIHHARQKENLLILDVSGSMSEGTIRRIIDDVVALSYNANAHMAVVSNHTTYWAPGSYAVADVLAAAEYGGTHYETLAPLFDRDWGTVITVADYDSSQSAKQSLARCKGHIDTVIDVSLVNQPTFLAECVGQLADNVRPILIASTYNVLV